MGPQHPRKAWAIISTQYRAARGCVIQALFGRPHRRPRVNAVGRYKNDQGLIGSRGAEPSSHVNKLHYPPGEATCGLCSTVQPPSASWSFPNGGFPMVRDMPGHANENLMVTPRLALLLLRACDLIASPSYKTGGFGRSVEDSKARFWPIIEALLAFGADPDVFFDFGLFPPGHVGDPPGRNEKGGGELDDLVSVSLPDLVLLDRPSNQAAVLDRISSRRGCWFWGSMNRAVEMLPLWAGARYGLPKLEPAHRRVSVLSWRNT